MPDLPGKPKRTLDVRLWSPLIAPDGATATLAPPTGLKQGDKLDLELYRPTPAAGPETGPGGPGGGSGQSRDFTIKIYWGSSPTVQPGQPKIIKLGDLNPEQTRTMMQHAQAMHSAAGSYFYKAGWTTGHWPTSADPGQIADDASLVGTYSLTSTYAGNVTIDAPSNVDFMAPIEISSPSLDSKVPLDAAIPFQWSSIANALGQYASIMGMEGESTLIVWSSSEVYNDRLMADMGYLQMAEVRERVNEKLFMPGNQTQVTVPAGIFANADIAALDMIAYGPGAARDEVQPVPRIQTKSTLRVILGGKKTR